MPFQFSIREQCSLTWFSFKWLCLAIPLGLIVGTACAVFLMLLDGAASARFRHPEIVYLLPIAGMAIGLLYALVGKSVEGGNNLIVDEIHEPGGGVPLRMAPLILIGTVVTHLFGGSAGREGTAVQMGGSLAGGFARLLPWLSSSDIRLLLMAGVSAGFGGVFGTPVAGTIFAMEVLAIGRMNYAAILPCIIAGIVSDQACLAWGIDHAHYQIASRLPEGSVLHLVPLSLPLVGKVVLIGIAFGLTSVLFAEVTHGLHQLLKRVVPWPIVRPFIGGVFVIGLMLFVGTRDYMGLGVSSPDANAITIASCFQAGGAHTWSWLWKIIFTAVTLSSGFKGGEVTPLFFIGAALGNTLAVLLGGPIDLFAALGLIAVFAGATNTPLACTMMGIELFGGENTSYFAIACFVSYLFSGHSGIYLSQRIGVPKIETHDHLAADTLRQVRDIRQPLFHFQRHSPPESFFEGARNNMSRPHRVVKKEIGQLRIYLPQGETRHKKGLKSLFGRPLFRELIDLAKSDGILNATSHATHYGYSKNGRVHSDSFEAPNPHLNVCVELIDQRDCLEKFCHQHAEILKDRVIVYKHLEHWELHDQHLDVTEATIEELAQEDSEGE